MTEPRSDLIYDVGLFDGEDTAYYLFRGYNVVAIDANPLMIERANRRFAKEIRAGRLTLLNLGISETPGTGVFWISDVPMWSSFDRCLASRNGTAHRPLFVSIVPFSQLLAEHGVPHYLKIDIEGSDKVCLHSLRGTTIPRYISVESECIADSASLSDQEAVAMLELLRDVGYQRFKLVNQMGWIPVPTKRVDLCMGFVIGAAQRSVSRWRRGPSKIAAAPTDPVQIQNLGFAFPPGSSGPWGDDIRASWMTFEKAKAAYLRERHSFFSRRRRPPYPFWYDWHATY